MLGSAAPDTLLIKATQGANQPPYAFTTGPLGMYRSFPAMTVLAFVPALLGIVALSAWARIGAAPHHAAPAAVSMVTVLIVVGQVGYNVQHGIPWTQAAYNGNAATPTEYAAVGRGIRCDPPAKLARSPISATVRFSTSFPIEALRCPC